MVALFCKLILRSQYQFYIAKKASKQPKEADLSSKASKKVVKLIAQEQYKEAEKYLKNLIVKGEDVGILPRYVKTAKRGARALRELDKGLVEKPLQALKKLKTGEAKDRFLTEAIDRLTKQKKYIKAAELLLEDFSDPQKEIDTIKNFLLASGYKSYQLSSIFPETNRKLLADFLRGKGEFLLATKITQKTPKESSSLGEYQEETESSSSSEEEYLDSSKKKIAVSTPPSPTHSHFTNKIESETENSQPGLPASSGMESLTLEESAKSEEITEQERSQVFKLVLQKKYQEARVFLQTFEGKNTSSLQTIIDREENLNNAFEAIKRGEVEQPLRTLQALEKGSTTDDTLIKGVQLFASHTQYKAAAQLLLQPFHWSLKREDAEKTFLQAVGYQRLQIGVLSETNRKTIAEFLKANGVSDLAINFE